MNLDKPESYEQYLYETNDRWERGEVIELEEEGSIVLDRIEGNTHYKRVLTKDEFEDWIPFDHIETYE